MKATIHYEDNLYFLKEKIRLLGDVVSLDLAPEFYIDHMLEEISFIDATLGRIFTHLRQAGNLIHKNRYLYLLAKTKNRFVEIIKKILSEETPLSSGFIRQKDHFYDRIDVHVSEIKKIQRSIEELQSSRTPEEELITSEEMNFLWDPGSEDSED